MKIEFFEDVNVSGYRTEKLAVDIFASYRPGENITCMCVLKGAFGFFSALTSALQTLNQYASQKEKQDIYSLTTFDENGVDDDKWKNESRPLFFEFIQVSSYVNDESSGKVQITGIPDFKKSVSGKVKEFL